MFHHTASNPWWIWNKKIRRSLIGCSSSLQNKLLGSMILLARYTGIKFIRLQAEEDSQSNKRYFRYWSQIFVILSALLSLRLAVQLFSKVQYCLWENRSETWTCLYHSFAGKIQQERNVKSVRMTPKAHLDKWVRVTVGKDQAIHDETSRAK